MWVTSRFLLSSSLYIFICIHQGLPAPLIVCGGGKCLHLPFFLAAKYQVHCSCRRPRTSTSCGKSSERESVPAALLALRELQKFSCSFCISVIFFNVCRTQSYKVLIQTSWYRAGKRAWDMLTNSLSKPPKRSSQRRVLACLFAPVTTMHQLLC